MASFFTNNINQLYNKITALFTTEEDSLKNLLTNFFADYDDIIQENKIIFILHIQKLSQIKTYDEAYCHSNLFVNKTNNSNIIKSKKNNTYKYKYTFSPENYKQEKKLFYVNLYIPFIPLKGCNMILKKYNYSILLVDNCIQSLIKKDKVKIRDYTEITLKSVITEIIDFIIIY
jgi:hypothetical protein